MVNFNLKDSDDYCLCLSEPPKRFDADSPATNVFFDDTNGQVFTVRSGGVTGVTVTSMDETKCTSFRMEDRGPIISIKLSPDQNILAIQRNLDNQSATVEFVNFKDLAPTNIEYSHTCKWKNAKILGFVWPKVNEVAFITDHGIELLQVFPDKKLLKSLKHTSFSGAWFSWCAQSNTILLASNNGTLLQPFLLNNSAITKLQKLELEAGRPVTERDAFVVRVRATTWCAVFQHGAPAVGAAAPPPAEVWMMAVSGGAGASGGAHTYTHVLKTGLSGRFAVSVVDDLLVVHHQASQTSQVFDIQEEGRVEGGHVVHAAILASDSIRPAFLHEHNQRQPCPMYSGTWVVFQPDYIIDARLGCLWTLRLQPSGLAHDIPKEDISRIVAVLLRRSEAVPGVKETLYRILRQLVTEAKTYLAELASVFDEINSVYRKWADSEMARNTAGALPAVSHQGRLVVTQADMCSHVLQPCDPSQYIVQVVTAYLASLTRHDMVVQHVTAELTVRSLVTRGAGGRLRSLARRAALGGSRVLACALLSLGRLHPAAPQLALDMMHAGGAHQDIIEVLLSWNDPISAIGVCRSAGGGHGWSTLSPRKLLSAAAKCPPHTYVAVMHALMARNERTRGSTAFLKSEQCDSYVQLYKNIMEQ